MQTTIGLHIESLSDAMNKFLVVALLCLYIIGCSTTITTRINDRPVNDNIPSLNPIEYPFSTEDLDVMYRTVYGEVGKQEDQEIKAVCNVIYNRWQSGAWGNNLQEVLLAPKQFSVWNPGTRSRRFISSRYVYDMPRFDHVKTLCNEVIQDRLQGVDYSNGYNYYYHPHAMEPRCVRYKRIFVKLRLRHRGHIIIIWEKRYRCTRWRRLPPPWSHEYEERERIGQGIFLRKGITNVSY